MRRLRMTIQNQMVAMIFLAIPLWAGPVLMPEAVRRWITCRDAAARHATEAAWMKKNLASIRSRGDPARMREIWQRDLDYHTSKSREYRQALYLPWRSYALGSEL
jgi:hypothetical protein